MRLTLAFAFLLTASVARQVEHAPTVAQYQADQRLWLATIEENNDGSPEIPAYRVLSKWSYAMSDCEKVDPDNRRKYYNTRAEILATQQSRLLNFIDRHDLYNKFLEEDAAGKR